MTNNTTGNASTAQNPEAQGPTCRDWREMRREWREKRRASMRRFPFPGLWLGVALVLFGTLFLLHQQGHLAGGAWWQYLLIGLGSISIVNGLARLVNRDYWWVPLRGLTIGIIIVIIGSLFLAGLGEWWPIALVVGGVVLLTRFIWRR